MKNIDPNGEEANKRNERSPLQQIVDRQEKYSTQSDPTEKDPYDEFMDRMRFIGRKLRRFLIKRIAKGWRQTKFHDRVNVWIAVIGLIALVVYTAYTIKMYSANRQSADAASRAADSARDAITIGQRPWLGLASYAVTKAVSISEKGDFRVGVSFTIKNFGNSPALNAAFDVAPVKFDLKVFENIKQDVDDACEMASIDASFALSKKETDKATTGADIFPSNTFVWDMSIGRDDFTKIDSNSSLILAGCIGYIDQFKNVVHHTPICLRSNVAASKVAVGQLLFACGTGRSAD